MSHSSAPSELPTRPLLVRYAQILTERAIPRGLIAEGDRGRIMERHVLDSLRALACLRHDDRTLADIGSGAGLPGIPLAIARAEVRVTLVEPRRMRSAFLELVMEELGLANVEVAGTGAERLDLAVDVCTARAVGSAARSYQLASRLLRPGGRLLYFAGTSWPDLSQQSWLAKAHVIQETCSPAVFPTHGPIVMMRASDHPQREEKEPQHPRS